MSIIIGRSIRITSAAVEGAGPWGEAEEPAADKPGAFLWADAVKFAADLVGAAGARYTGM